MQVGIGSGAKSINRIIEGLFNMRKEFTLFGVIFFCIASFVNVAMARNSPNIYNQETGRIISARVSFIFTFDPDGSNFKVVPEITGLAYFNAITYGNNTYVAVADDATIWYSPNGNNGTWKEAKLHGEADFQAVEYGGNGRFVAVATEGTIWYSDDGANWVESQSPDLSTYDPNFYDVIYANGVFVAVGAVGNPATGIFTSTDGESWHIADVFLEDCLNGGFTSIAYGNNTFVAVGTNGRIYMSNDNGWKNVSLPRSDDPDIDHNLHAVTYGKGVFVAVGDNASIWYSHDGTNWTSASGSIDQDNQIFSSVTYGNGVFVAVIGDLSWDWHPLDKTIWFSTDGVFWQVAAGLQENPCSSSDYSTFTSVDFFGDFFIATSGNAYSIATYPEYYSPDGQNWSSVQQNMGGCNAPGPRGRRGGRRGGPRPPVRGKPHQP